MHSRKSDYRSVHHNRIEAACDTHPEVPVFSIQMVNMVASDRESVCRQLGLSLSEGKELLTRVLNGGRLDDSVASERPLLQTLSSEGGALRRLAVTELLEVYKQHAFNPERRWLEAAKLFDMWTYAEDACQEVRQAETVLLPVPPLRLSASRQGEECRQRRRRQ